ncbi:MAG: dienelactone hydrolase family protein, partial [Parvularculaceae bacterium]
MQLQPIRYSAGGQDFEGLLADGSKGAKAPGVLVAHESPGLTAHIEERTLRLGELGYVAFALDLFGAHGLSLDEARGHSAHVVNTPGLMLLRTRAALEALAGVNSVDPARLAAAGFCLGGAAALELARAGAPIRWRRRCGRSSRTHSSASCVIPGSASSP